MDEPVTIFGNTITTGGIVNLIKYQLKRLPGLYRFVKYRFRLDFEDIVQDCFVKILSEGRLDKWETEDIRPSTGICHCVYWTLKSYGTRKGHHESPLPHADQEWVDQFWARVEQARTEESRHNAIDVRTAIESVLLPHEQDLLARRYFGKGMILREYAAEMGCSPQNIEQLEKRAFIKLRKALSR